MASLILICPKTGEEFPTGVVGDRDALRKAEYKTNKSRCPFCGETHSWSKEHTRVVD
jgi:hypothetical protein